MNGEVIAAGVNVRLGRFASRGAVFTICIIWLLVARNAHAQSCGPITVGPITQTADLSVKTEDGACVIDGSSNGAYVKLNTNYRLHIDATVGGHCQSRVYQYPPGTCVNSTYYTRTIGTTWQYVDYPTFAGSVLVNPSNTTTIQNYNTTGSVNTLSSGSVWASSTEGPRIYTSSTNGNATNCNITPTSFPQNQSITINVLKCKPKWWSNNDHLGVPPNGDKVKIYLPSTMNGAATVLDNVILSWNTAIAVTGVVFERVTTACADGPDCITVAAVSHGTSCGWSSWLTLALGGGGVIQTGMKLDISPNWTGWNTDSLTRTFIHELGHFLGADNLVSPCQPNDAAMQDQFSCGPTATPMTTILPSDSIPIVNSVYNGKSKKTCGF